MRMAIDLIASAAGAVTPVTKDRWSRAPLSEEWLGSCSSSKREYSTRYFLAEAASCTGEEYAGLLSMSCLDRPVKRLPVDAVCLLVVAGVTAPLFGGGLGGWVADGPLVLIPGL